MGDSDIVKTKEKILGSLNKTVKNLSVLLYYPVYINTFALAHILKKGISIIDAKRRPINDHPGNFEARMFNWMDIVPPDLEKEFENHPDIIYCFSSTDKERVFRQEVAHMIQSKNLPYEISNPFSPEATQDNESIDVDVDYSNFSVKYLFFENKINLEQIHEFAKEYFVSHERTQNPYLTKLISILLARGYQTIQIDSDIQDESKGLLRKLLHEEFGFKFRITPNAPEFKANNTLVLETKGGQQSFEETERQVLKGDQKPYSDLKTFVVPDKIKYTSKTKIIAIYKKSGVRRQHYNETRAAIKSLSSLIFSSIKDEQKRLFEDKVYEDFVVENIQFILDLVKQPNNKFTPEKYETIKNSNSFLKSLHSYALNGNSLKKEIKKLSESDCTEEACRKSELFRIVTKEANCLQIESRDNFIECLNDHHVNINKSNYEVALKASFAGEYLQFSQEMCDHFKEDERLHKVMLSGLFLLKLILHHPNGIPGDKIDKPEKQIEFIKDLGIKKDDFVKLIQKNGYPMLEENKFINCYNNLRIIAEDLNYLIVEEKLLADPKIILKIFDGLDLSEFEYLFSMAYPKKFIKQNRSHSQN